MDGQDKHLLIMSIIEMCLKVKFIRNRKK